MFFATFETSPLFQVGTTSWLANFLLLSDDYRDLYDPKTGKIEGSKKLHKVVPQIFRAPVLKPYARKRLFEASVSFSIVRHPFERYETKIIISKVFIDIYLQIGVRLPRQAGGSVGQVLHQSCEPDPRHLRRGHLRQLRAVHPGPERARVPHHQQVVPQKVSSEGS